MTTIKVYPSDDTYAREESPGAVYGSDTSTYIMTYSPKSLYGFIKWDFSDIPPDAEISAATLYVNCKIVGNGGCPNIQIYRCDTDWAESSLNWNNMPGIIGDLIYSFDLTSTGWKNDGGVILSMVKGWVDKSIANYGIRLKEKNELAGYSILYSKEAGYFLYIEVTYTVPSPETEGIATVSGNGSLNVDGSKKAFNLIIISGNGNIIIKVKPPYIELDVILSSEERIPTLSIQERSADLDIQKRKVTLEVKK